MHLSEKKNPEFFILPTILLNIRSLFCPSIPHTRHHLTAVHHLIAAPSAAISPPHPPRTIGRATPQRPKIEARELVAKGHITFEFYNTEKQVADILSKSLPAIKFIYFRNQLGICSLDSRGSVRIDSKHIQRFFLKSRSNMIRIIRNKKLKLVST